MNQGQKFSKLLHSKRTSEGIFEPCPSLSRHSPNSLQELGRPQVSRSMQTPTALELLVGVQIRTDTPAPSPAPTSGSAALAQQQKGGGEGTPVLLHVNKAGVNTEPLKGWRLLRVSLRTQTVGHVLPSQAGSPPVWCSETTEQLRIIDPEKTHAGLGLRTSSLVFLPQLTALLLRYGQECGTEN